MKYLTTITILIAVLVVAAASAGLFYDTGGAHVPFTTVRGEHATYAGGGLYRYDAAQLAREGKVWDAVTLLVALPVFIVAIVLVRRNSLKGRLLLAGTLFYYFYMYLMYAVMVALNPMFAVYIAIFALSAVAFFMNLARIDVPALPAHITQRFPRRLTVGFMFALGAALVLLWGRMILTFTLADRLPDELAGMTTLETQAFDLGMVVPLAVASGVLLLRRSAWGYFLAGVTVTFGMIMCVVLPAWIGVPLVQDGKMNPLEAAPFLTLSVVGIVIAVLFFRSIREVGTTLPSRG